MAKIDINKTELVWPGKYNDDGTLEEVPRVSLPFQVVETVNESRATRESKKGRVQGDLFNVYEGKEGDTFEAGWKNKLIWGDNLLVLGSLLQKFAGKIDLIYIDPPFATGADFSFSTLIGDGQSEVTKEPSSIEDKAYRDTWGRGLASYLQMLRTRLQLARELLADDGSIYVHIGPNVSHYVKVALDDVFGFGNCRSEIVWRRSNSHNKLTGQFGPIHDVILFYSKTDTYHFTPGVRPFSRRYITERFKYSDKRGIYQPNYLTGPGLRRGDSGKPWRGFDPSEKGRHWAIPQSAVALLGRDVSSLGTQQVLDLLARIIHENVMTEAL
jgi:adenine-specific DNA-methyltransferase